METKLLTEHEINSLRPYNETQTKLIASLGQIEYQKTLLDNAKAELEASVLELETKSKELAASLTEKYGSGSINLETGEITIG
jgi:hypothetical protein